MTLVRRGGVFALVLTSAVIASLAVVPATTAQAMVQPSIVHGRDTSASEFGFIVAVGGKYVSGGRLYVQQDCAGTLVTPLKVITAAHCLWDSSGINRGADEIAVATGLDRRHQQAVEVATAVYHPDYDGDAGTYQNDIAVLTLKEPLLGTPRMLPVVRGSGPGQADLNAGLTMAGADVITAGWGSTTPSNTGEPNVATAADLTVFGANTCDGATSDNDKKVAIVIDGITFYQYPVGEIDDNVMICAMGVNDSGQIVDACGGDSGGPVTGGTGAARRLVGVVSWGPDPGLDADAGPDDVCAIHYAGVYTRVSAFSGPGEFLSKQGVPVTNPSGEPGKPALQAPVRTSDTQLRLSATASAYGTASQWIRFTVTNSVTKEASYCTAVIGGARNASCSVKRLDLTDSHVVTATAYDAAGDASPISLARGNLGAPVFGSAAFVPGTATLKAAVTAATAPGITDVSTTVSCVRGSTVALKVSVKKGLASLPFVTKGTYSCRAVSTYVVAGQRMTTLASAVLPVKIT